MIGSNQPHHLLYVWDEASPIGGLEARLDSDGYYVVHLFPGKEQKDGALSGAAILLHRYGFPDPYEDVRERPDGGGAQAVLTLANVKNLDKVTDALRRGGYVLGKPEIESLNGEAKKVSPKHGVSAWLDDPARAFGYVGLVGHAAILAAGLIQKPFDWGRITNAPLGASPAFLMSWLGAGKDYVDVPKLMRDMREFFVEEGISLPPMTEEAQYQGFLETAKHFLAAHPIEVGSSLGVLGSAGMIKSGIDGVRSGGTGRWRVTLGGINIIRDGIAVFVPEKKKKEAEVEAAQQAGWGGALKAMPGKFVHLVTHPGEIPGAVASFVHEAPLRMVGWLSLISDIGFFMDAKDGWKNNKLYLTKEYEEGRPEAPGVKAVRGRQTVLAEQRASRAVIDDLEAKFGMQTPDPALDKARYKRDLKAWETHYDPLIKERRKYARLEQEATAMRINQEMAKGWRGQLTPWLSFTTALAFLGASALMSLVSREHQSDDLGAEALFSRLCSLNAKILAAFPEERREDMLHKLTSYMRCRQEMASGKFTPERFEEEVRKRIAPLEHSPFDKERGAWIERVAASAAPANDYPLGAGMTVA